LYHFISKSLVLAGYLANKKVYPSGLVGKRVIEIGAGCGVTGIVAARLGADIIMTDLADEMDILDRNVSENLSEGERTKARTVELFWGEDASHVAPPFDIVLGADVV
jgi:predicted nicotinamide N-methyase